MRDNAAGKSIRLIDYRPPAFLVDTVDLDVDIHDGLTRVTSTLAMRRNPAREDRQADCVLDGEALRLLSVELDGVALDATAYRHADDTLTLFAVPDAFVLRTRVEIEPEKNTTLEGLYMSKGMYCTQCEAEGFRRITFFPDRPDVLSRFTTTVRAERARYPLLLSNGNPVAQGEEGERHWVRWEDPFAKPCYLFALVAADLACLEDTFVTCSGRQVALRIYAEQRDLDKLGHAMDSLKRAMRWDEETYGREYDLDIYMIVAVSHFNMGAMENKGLNIFNTACVLAHPQTTTDAGFHRVESVVAHEYFHNWSGNRVTCRDWFQLSLKEGFTVFRDQCFSADMHSHAVQRIEDVDMLRTMQFAEDGGPMAHPVRPDAYQKIDNFYTVTIYEKGAELVRMQYNLLGAEGFRRATDLYFSRFDGQAVTCDDFVDCMEEASGLDLAAFRRWYMQAGTPHLHLVDAWENGHYTLRVRQETLPTPGQPEKHPLMIPLTLALLDEDGNKLALDDGGNTERTLIIDQAEQVFRFELPGKPVPSLLRGFSAPVHLHYDWQPEQLLHLLAHDDDGFVRWDAARRLYRDAIRRVIGGADASLEAGKLAPAMEAVLASADADPAGAALILALPSEVALSEDYTPLDPDVLASARSALEVAIAGCLRAPLQTAAVRFFDGQYSADAVAAGRRSLCLRALTWLAALGGDEVAAQLAELFQAADNMTMRQGALRLLVWHRLPGYEEALAEFARTWREEALVMDQWFMVQASSPGVKAQDVEQLLLHELFDWTTPNRVRAVLSAFANSNLTGFHNTSGDGYQVFAESLARLDRINPQIAARLAGAAAVLPRLEPRRRGLLAEQLARLQSSGVSANLDEVLGRILAAQ